MMDNSFNDDFSNIFDDSIKEEEVEYDLEHFMSFVDGSNNLETRYKNICNVIYKFLHKTSLIEMQAKIFEHLMPAVSELLITIFKDIANVLSAGDGQSSGAKVLRDHILMCLGAYQVLDCILRNLLQNDIIEFCYIQSVPTELANILLVTFRHCKESEKMYKSYFSELKDIVQLFRLSQDIHSKLLQLLTSRVTYNFEAEPQIALFKQLLINLEEIGEVLVDMNLKALTINWKGYVALIDKHSGVLIQDNFSTKKPMEFITLLIVQNLEKVLKMDNSDQKNYNCILKMCNFFYGKFLKLHDIFWESDPEILPIILNYFTSIYRFYPNYLDFKSYNKSITVGIDTLIFNSCQPLMERCIVQSEFVNAIGKMNVKENLDSPGLLFFVLDVFLKMSDMSNGELNVIEVDVLLETLFKIITESYVEFFWTIEIPTKSSVNANLYEQVWASIAKIILVLDSECFNKIECILLRNVVQENAWNALIAIEIWHSVLRCNEPELTFNTLENIITLTNPLLLNTFNNKPQRVFLESLLNRLYLDLSQTHRIQLIEKYSIPSHLHLWRCFTFNDFPPKCIVFIESFLISVTENVDEFKKGKCTTTDFRFLCDSFDVIATLPTSLEINLNHFINKICKLWEFEVNLTALQNGSLLKLFIKKLFSVTSHFALNLTGQQLVLLLSKVRALCCTFFQVEILQLLRHLSNKSLNQLAEKSQIETLLSSIFIALCSDANPIIKQLFLETFVCFLNETPQEVILKNVVRTNGELQSEVANFIQRKVVNQNGQQVLSADDYFSKLKSHKFRHKCADFLHPVENGVSLNIVSERIKADLELLYRMSDKKFVENCVADVISSFK